MFYNLISLCTFARAQQLADLEPAVKWGGWHTGCALVINTLHDQVFPKQIALVFVGAKNVNIRVAWCSRE